MKVNDAQKFLAQYGDLVSRCLLLRHEFERHGFHLGTQMPNLDRDGALVEGDPGDGQGIAVDGDEYVHFARDRGKVKPLGRFSRFEDAAKHWLRPQLDDVRRRCGVDPRAWEWGSGLAPGAEVAQVGALRRLSLTAVPGAYCLLGDFDAVLFSHLMPMTVDQVWAYMLDGLPAA